MKRNNVKNLAFLSILLGLSVAVGILESFISLPIPVPGVKIGLANFINLFVLYYFDLKSYITVGFIRVCLSALLWGRFGITFLFSLVGWLLSSAGVTLVFLSKKFSIYGISVLGACLHQIGQMTVAVFVYGQAGLIYYLPFLIITAVLTGTIIAFITKRVICSLNVSMIKFLN